MTNTKIKIFFSTSGSNYMKSLLPFHSKMGSVNCFKLSREVKENIEFKAISKLLEFDSKSDIDEYMKLPFYHKENYIKKAIKNEIIFAVEQMRKSFDLEFNDEENFILSDQINLETFIESFSWLHSLQWCGLSMSEELNWNPEIIEKGKLNWDWVLLQNNSSVTKYFEDLFYIEKFEDYLDWDILTSNNKIKWNLEILKKNKNRISFNGNFGKKVNWGDNPYDNRWGLSSNPNLSKEILLEFIDLWHWDTLSYTPSLMNLDIFETEIFKRINLSNLNINEGVTLFHLRKLKEIYNSVRLQTNLNFC
jgi:hypothetical protein